jgi:rod shape-determining protein MreB
MVIDIGGGTTNIAVIALSGIVCDASIRTGGDELDQSIVQYMRKTFSLLVGEPTAERIKIQLGSAVPLVPEEEDGREGSRSRLGLPKTVRIDSSGVRDAMQEPLSRIVNAVRRAPGDDAARAGERHPRARIVLTGGGALIRGLPQLLMEETGLPVRTDEDPLTSVVRGTGRILDDPARFGSVLTT